MRPEIPQHGVGHNATPAATATAPPGSPRTASPAATEPSHRGRTGRRSGCADSMLFVHRVSGLLGKRGQENVRLGNGQIHARFPGQNVVESDKYVLRRLLQLQQVPLDAVRWHQRQT